MQTILADNRARALKFATSPVAIGAFLTLPLLSLHRDNNLIYLEAVTPLSSLPPIVPATMARPTPPAPITSPLTHLHTSPGGLGQPYFSSLVPYEVHLALSLYADRKYELMKEELSGRAEEMDAKEARVLCGLGLPASIEALSQPVGVPPSLVERSREVRAEGGVERLRNMLGDVRKVARVNQKIMNEVKRFCFQSNLRCLLELIPYPSHTGNRRPRSREGRGRLAPRSTWHRSLGSSPVRSSGRSAQR